MHKEYGCGEAGKLYTGYNGTKILHERGLKTPKMMKDQFDDLCTYMGSKEKKMRKLETIGFIHAGMIHTYFLFTRFSTNFSEFPRTFRTIT